MAQARLRNASWMSSRISQRIRSRRNQCNNAIDCSTTQRCAPRPEPCPVPRRAITGGDPLGPDPAAVLVMVIAPVGVDRLRPLARPARPAAYWRDGRDQRHQLGDVVALAAGQRHRQRDPVRLGDQVVLGARLGAVNRARAGFRPPFSARTCEPSITALDQSSAPAPFSSASSS